MLGKNHLHIDENDMISDWLVKSMKSLTRGTIEINTENQLAAQIDISNDRIAINLLQTEFFRVPDDETGLFDKLKTSKEFGHKLSENRLTLSVLRKGKEAITLGYRAKPKLSKLITRSNDIQVDSVKETTKLKREFKAAADHDM
jgi:hypothetical protein